MYNLENVNTESLESLKIDSQEETNLKHFSKEKQRKLVTNKEITKNIKIIKSILLDIESFEESSESEKLNSKESEIFRTKIEKNFLKLCSKNDLFKKNKPICRKWDNFFKGEIDKVTLKTTDFKKILESKLKELELDFKKSRKVSFLEKNFEKLITNASLSTIESYLEIVRAMIEIEKNSLGRNRR